MLEILAPGLCVSGLVRRSPVSRPLPLDDMVPLFDDEESSPFDDNDDVPMLQVLW